MATSPPRRSSAPRPRYNFKVLTIGDALVGKTTLLHTLCRGEVDLQAQATIGVDFVVLTLHRPDYDVRLTIWDTAGQEKYRAIATSFFRGVQAAMLVGDISSPGTFQHIFEARADGHKSWIEELSTHCEASVPKLLVVNKADLVPPEEWDRREDVEVNWATVPGAQPVVYSSAIDFVRPVSKTPGVHLCAVCRATKELGTGLRQSPGTAEVSVAGDKCTCSAHIGGPLLDRSDGTAKVKAALEQLGDLLVRMYPSAFVVQLGGVSLAEKKAEAKSCC